MSEPLSLGHFMALSHPWILGLLAVLPLVWWLVRLTPPAPRKVIFPALSLLRDLEIHEQSPSHTPWWILVLRLLIATLLILAFTHPTLHPGSSSTERGRLLIIIDNDWASARAWELRQQSLHDLIHQAEKDHRDILLLPTALDDKGSELSVLGPMSAKSAYGVADQIHPEPWPSHWQKILSLVQSVDCPTFAETVWMSSGLADIDTKALYLSLQQRGPVKLLSDNDNPIYLLSPPQNEGDQSVLTLRRAHNDEDAVVSIAGVTKEGHRLSEQPAHFPVGAYQTTLPLNLPLDIRNQIARFELNGQPTAATTVLLDDSWQKKPVGLVGDVSMLDQHSLLNGLFYIDRALKPFADLHVADLDHLLQQNMALIIVTDATPFSEQQKPALKKWIEQGGVLIRFAGKNLEAQSQETPDDLLPVTLREGDRAMSGSMSWGTPQKLRDFPAASPFRGLQIPEDVRINRQILAEPAPTLSAHSWVSLEDGTPLVTAKNIGQGTTVLFHVPVQSDWSNLPLSGLFVEMLRRMIDFSHSRTEGHADFSNQPPWRVLDAFGEEQKPNSTAMTLPRDDMARIILGPQHPPGLYGSEHLNVALNMGSVLGQPEALSGLPVDHYQLHRGDVELQPYLLMFVFVLLLLDYFVSVYRRGFLSSTFPKKRLLLSIFFVVFCVPMQSAMASSLSYNPVDLTGKTYLAYIQSDDSTTNHIAERGLIGLAHVLQRRTSIEQIAVLEVNPEQQDLAYYALLYWPLRSGMAPLSVKSVDHINSYLHHGGMILLDAMQGEDLSPIFLQRILAGIDLPPLVRLPEEHVLKHSFYILDEFPGRYNATDFWLESEDTSSYDGVATVLYGVNGWAAAWAMDEQGQPLFPCVPGGEIQRERAYRFGVNLVMYALTGNYKSDQLHAQSLLRKLGK